MKWVYLRVRAKPEETEDCAACDERDERETVSQRVQSLHHQVENKLDRKRNIVWETIYKYGLCVVFS